MRGASSDLAGSALFICKGLRKRLIFRFHVMQFMVQAVISLGFIGSHFSLAWVLLAIRVNVMQGI